MTPDIQPIRAAINALPSTCYYHGVKIDPMIEGRQACCDTGVPAVLRRDALAALQRVIMILRFPS